jgi:hypothetical protein
MAPNGQPGIGRRVSAGRKGTVSGPFYVCEMRARGPPTARSG